MLITCKQSHFRVVHQASKETELRVISVDGRGSIEQVSELIEKEIEVENATKWQKQDAQQESCSNPGNEGSGIHNAGNQDFYFEFCNSLILESVKDTGLGKVDISASRFVGNARKL